MKINIRNFRLYLVCAVVFMSYYGFADAGTFEELTITISNKTGSILPFQPVELDISLRNDTSNNIYGYLWIISDIHLELYISKGRNYYEMFSSNHIMGKSRLRPSITVFKPNQSYKDPFGGSLLLSAGRYVNIDRNKTRYLFKQPGYYRFHVVLNDLNMKVKIVSNVEVINVMPAVGVDAKALSLLMQITNHIDILYRPILRDKTEKKRVEKVLEKIINECEGSTYAKYACRILALSYKGDKDRPKTDVADMMKKALRNEKTWIEKGCLDFLVRYYCDQKNLKKAQMYSRKIGELFTDQSKRRSDEILISRLESEIENKNKVK